MEASSKTCNLLQKRKGGDSAMDKIKCFWISSDGLEGKTIYIDRHLPRSFRTNGKEVAIDQFLILHEAVEKSLLNELGLVYQYAHQIALRAEEAAVRAEGVSWRDYDRFMEQFIKEAGDERLNRIPPDLDVKPYRDEHDVAMLTSMQKVIQRELRQSIQRKGQK